MLDHVKQRNRY